jgi:hypothetical protein
MESPQDIQPQQVASVAMNLKQRLDRDKDANPPVFSQKQNQAEKAVHKVFPHTPCKDDEDEFQDEVFFHRTLLPGHQPPSLIRPNTRRGKMPAWQT